MIRSMMLLSPRPRSAPANLLRLLAVWLAAIVFMQGIAAAQALGEGPLHHHLEFEARAGLATPQHHQHDHAERHVHAAEDHSVRHVGSHADAMDSAALALTAALALMLLGGLLRSLPDTRRHVWRPTPPWAWRNVISAALLRPPRPG